MEAPCQTHENNSENRVGSTVGGGKPILFIFTFGNDNAFVC